MMKKHENSIPVVLLSDFGYNAPYVGEIKGMIQMLYSCVPVIDLSHGIEPYNIRQCIFFLVSSLKSFRKGAVFLIAMDPGTSGNRGLVCIYEDYKIVGPDNGVFVPFIEEGKFYEIDESLFASGPSTFRGRDVFAPVAALIAQGKPVEEIGKSAFSHGVQPCDYLAERRGGEITGFIFYEDRFGNWITNIPNSFYSDLTRVYILINHISLEVSRKAANFSELKEGEAGIIRGSSGFIELAANRIPVKSVFNIKKNFNQIQVKGVL
jgi:S-adenosylmethionine hydrolase